MPWQPRSCESQASNLKVTAADKDRLAQLRQYSIKLQLKDMAPLADGERSVKQTVAGSLYWISPLLTQSCALNGLILTMQPARHTCGKFLSCGRLRRHQLHCWWM